jgi:hypothetical protein
MCIRDRYLTASTIILFISGTLTAQQNEIIVAESDIFDTGKMWTFDFPPIEYLKENYDFEPDDDWFNDVRLSALRIPGCTASFVSGNGLIMTNNHCSPRHRDKVQLENENLAETGFYAKELHDERKVPNMYAEQLSFILDVTDEVISVIDSGNTTEEKIILKEKISKQLVEKYNSETGLKCQLVSLFNGGKYSIYGYRRFEDIRLVFIPEDAIGYFGGDYDNFTYPRYNLDCAFFRIYDDEGNPLESPNFYKFSENGVQQDEVIFSIGNPGRTNRLHTVAQLKYYRDISYRNRTFLYDEYYALLGEAKFEYPERAGEFEKLRTRIGNSQKVFHYTLEGLSDPYLIARKEDFENNLKDFVEEDPELKDNYLHVWKSIEDLREELKPVESRLAAYQQSRFFGSEYFRIAEKIVNFAEQMSLPVNERSPFFESEKTDSMKNAIYPKDIDTALENIKLQIQLEYIRLNLGDEDDFVQMLCGDLHGQEAAERLLDISIISNREKTLELLSENPEHILNSEDPVIYFIKNTKDEISKLKERSDEIKDTEGMLVNMLGRVLFEIYGTDIPPDANFTLRLSDGILESFDYNGTVAIEKTTFFGMYDRYYGSDKVYPWNLPPRWENPPSDFDLSTTFNFISNNDIIGGNSGSAVINKNAEVVGLAFDGNIHSIIGNFIYLPEDNRMVSVASQAILESLSKIYKADRIYKELKSGTISR